MSNFNFYCSFSFQVFENLFSEIYNLSVYKINFIKNHSLFSKTSLLALGNSLNLSSVTLAKHRASISSVLDIIGLFFLSEIGNINRFSSSDKLAKYAGIAPVSFSSGGKEKNVNSKFGNRQLNSMIFTLSWVQINCGRNKNQPYNSIFYEYFMKKIKEGKTRHQAINSVMRRIINIIYGMLKNNASYIHPKQLSDNCLEIFDVEYEKSKKEKLKSCNK